MKPATPLAILLALLLPAPAAAQTTSGVDALVARAQAYAQEFERAFALVSSEERYSQHAKGDLSGNARGRSETTLQSVYVIARAADGSGWTPFRDVVRVDGHPVHNREERLAELFLTPSAADTAQASRIMEESARHNIGVVRRTINIPVLAILFLMPEHADRFVFEDAGTARVGRDTARVVSFEEQRYPTLVRTTFGVDQPSQGRLWIEPETGRILKTEHVTEGAEIHSVVTTTYRWDETLAMMVPARMDEEYRSYFAGGRIRGTATYANYRRFSVTTDERVAEPTPPGD